MKEPHGMESAAAYVRRTVAWQAKQGPRIAAAIQAKWRRKRRRLAGHEG